MVSRPGPKFNQRLDNDLEQQLFHEARMEDDEDFVSDDMNDFIDQDDDLSDDYERVQRRPRMPQPKARKPESRSKPKTNHAADAEMNADTGLEGKLLMTDDQAKREYVKIFYGDEDDKREIDYDYFLDMADKSYIYASNEIYDHEEGGQYGENTKPFVDLSELFAPEELASKLLTNKDERIKLLDVPERMQEAWNAILGENLDLNESYYPQPTDNDLEEQTDWILFRMRKKLSVGSPSAPVTDFDHIRYSWLGVEELPPEYDAQGSYQGRERDENATRAAVFYALKSFYRDYREVPFLDEFRRDFFARLKVINDAG